MAKTKTKRIEKLKKHLLEAQTQVMELSARVEPVSGDDVLLAAMWTESQEGGA